jgi:PAS domain S-box-containing protein
LTIASSNRNDPDSFVGKSYNFRPYFQDAVSGKLGSYFGTGVTSGERGYYVAAPVKNPQDEILGAVVIKKNAKILEDYFKHYSYAFLVDPHGIIFLSSSPELIFKNLWPIDAKIQSGLILSRQFGDIPLNQPLFSKEIFNDSHVTYGKNDFYVLRKDINLPGWSVISFNSVKLVLYYRFFGIAIVIFICIIIAIFYVVLERERELSELTADSEKEWSLTFDSMADGVSIHSPDFEIINVNKTLCELLGRKKEELIGQKCYHIFHSKNSPISECPLEKSKGSKQKEYVEVFESTLGKWLAVSVSPVLDGRGNIIKIIHLIRDITERKRLEGMKDEFVSTVSHELRTPLTAIKEGIGIVLDGLAGSINADQKDFLDTSKKNVDRLARLINNVLDYQKLQAGKASFDMKEGDINSIVEDVKEIMLPLARNKGLEFNVNLAKDLPGVAFDKDKITQVLINLVNNAIKFTDKGSITIATSKKYDNTICVSVVDTGAGILAGDINKLFHSFSQVGDGKEKRAGGTGLGLAISRAIVQEHGGKIWVESEYGKGSAFNFILPITERRITK